MHRLLPLLAGRRRTRPTHALPARAWRSFQGFLGTGGATTPLGILDIATNPVLRRVDGFNALAYGVGTSGTVNNNKYIRFTGNPQLT